MPMGKPVFGYSNVRGTLIERLAALPEFVPFMPEAPTTGSMPPTDSRSRISASSTTS